MATPGAAGVGAPVAAPIEGIDPDIAAQLQELLQAARDAPMDATARGRLGMAYDVSDMSRAALESFRQASQLDPDNPKWTYYRALGEAGTGDLDQALGSIDRVLELAPSYSAAHLYQGQWLQDLGREAEALAAFRQATSLEPANPAGRMGEARILLNRGENDAALALLQGLAETYKHPYIQQLIGRAYRQKGDLDRAEAVLKSAGAGSRPPGWPDPWNDEKVAFQTGFGAKLRQAGKLMNSGKAAEALVLLEGLRDERPGDVATLNNLSVSYLQANRMADAKAVLLDAVQRHPDYFPFRLNLAEIYRRERDGGNSLAQLDEALRINPTLSQAWQQKSSLMIAMRRIPDALDAMNKAILYDARNSRLFMSAAVLEYQLKRYPQALARADQAISVEPNSGPAHLVRATTLMELGKFDEAESALAQAERLGVSEKRISSTRKQLAARKAGS